MRETLPVPPLGAAGRPWRRIAVDVGRIPSLCYQFLARCVHMSHRVSPVIRPRHAGYALGGIFPGSPAGNTPTRTYQRSTGENREEIGDQFLTFHPLVLSACQ